MSPPLQCTGKRVSAGGSLRACTVCSVRKAPDSTRSSCGAYVGRARGSAMQRVGTAAMPWESDAERHSHLMPCSSLCIDPQALSSASDTSAACGDLQGATRMWFKMACATSASPGLVGTPAKRGAVATSSPWVKAAPVQRAQRAPPPTPPRRAAPAPTQTCSGTVASTYAKRVSTWDQRSFEVFGGNQCQVQLHV